jgi:hypothetical protein
MKGLVFASSVNRPGEHDASYVFVPGARQFARKYGLSVTPFDETQGHHKQVAHDTVFNTIRAARQLDVIAYFGHGLPHALGSAGIAEAEAPALAAAINAAAAPDCKVILYACWCGIPGGFAETLSRSLSAGITVFGHSQRGHAYQNPYVARYPYRPEDTQPFIIEHGCSTLWHEWNKELHGNSELWMRYPFMTKAEVERWLGPLPTMFPPVYGRGRCWSADY